MSEMQKFVYSVARFFLVSLVAASFAPAAFGQSLVGRNTNAVGPTPDGFYKGIPHYQDNEPHCDRNPLLPSNIVCMANGQASPIRSSAPP